MAIHENLIWRTSYQESHLETSTKVIEIYLITTYPDTVTPEQKATIINCSTKATHIAYTTFTSTHQELIDGTEELFDLISIVNTSIKSAEIAARKSFNEYTINSLPYEILNKIEIKIKQGPLTSSNNI
ncbi:hypothetical protein [Clostridium cylindrosporum]|uniref:Uncharacterized protein n=1 Tax=Clostridium cylindrosporum DSM 605 TaxID=1121307 RepID=A0A0J8G4C6_CLOCY|nr:hypothetical protein [Clostridium cylindrosporum]KMT22521.1 hypothetical protein CLCY_10c00660 [Clostridium cylindrosporum DSM 605]